MGNFVSDAWEGVKDIGGKVWEATVDVVTLGQGDRIAEEAQRGFMDILGIEIPDYPKAIINANRVQQVLDPDYRLPVVYGETEIAGNVIFYETTGTRNKYLDIVVAVCEGEIGGFTEVYMNDDPIAIFSNGTPFTPEISTTTVNNPFYDGLIEAYFYNGTDTQTANAQLVASHPQYQWTIFPSTPFERTFTFKGWTSNHKATGIAYVYFRLTHNAAKFGGGMPQFKFKVQGKKVIDIREPILTYDVSGNPALSLYDYLINTRYGKGLATTDIDLQSFKDAANDCDMLRNGFDVDDSPVTYKIYQIGAIVDTKNKIKDNTTYFLQSMGAMLPYIDGKYYLKVLKAGDASVTFDETNIIGGISLSSTNKNTRFNKVIVSFPDKARHYKVGNAPFDNAIYLSQDNGELLETNITTPYIDYYPRAQDFAELTMNLSRVGTSVAFTSTMDALKVIPGDIIGITYPTFGWTNKEFRLQKLSIRPDGLCDIQATEHDDSFYVLTDKNEQQSSGDTKLQAATTVVAPTITSAISNNSTHLLTVDGLILPRIYVTWTDNDNYPLLYNIYAKKSIEASFVKVGTLSYNDATAFYIPNVDWGTSYDVGVSTTNTIGFESDITSTTVLVPNPLSELIYTYPNVTGLELIGVGTNEGQGNNTEFTGQDIKLQWRLSSSNVTFEFGSTSSEAMGGAGGVLPLTLIGYRIEVYHPGDLLPRQEYFATSPNFVYSFDKNFEDGDGVPSRTVTFHVYAVGQVSSTGSTGESEKPAKITVTNPAPTLPLGVAIGSGFQTLTLSYTRPNLSDWDGILVWMDTTSGFTPSAANLVYSGTDNKIVLTNLLNGTAYYLRFALRDTFVPTSQTDTTGLTLSAEYTQTTLNAIGASDLDDLSNWATQITPVDLAFIEANMQADAIPSTKIASLVAGKIVAGTIASEINIAGVFRAASIDWETGLVPGDWRLDMGPVDDDPLNPANPIYIMRWHDGAGDVRFSMDTTGALELTQAIFRSSTTGKRIEINPSSDNEIHFYGDRGDTVVEELATIGVKTIGSDVVIGNFGSSLSTHYGIIGTSSTKEGVMGFSGSAIGTRGSSDSNVGIFGEQTSSPYTTDIVAGVAGVSDDGYGVVAFSLPSGKSPLLIKAAFTDSAPSGSAEKGSVWVTGAGALYINNDGSTGWTLGVNPLVTNSSPAHVAWRFRGVATTESTTTATTGDSEYKWASADANNISLRSNIAGSVTVSVRLSEAGGGIARFAVFVNGSLSFILSDTTNYPTFGAAQTGTITVAQGDEVTLSLYADGTTGAAMRDLQILTDQPTVNAFSM